MPCIYCDCHIICLYFDFNHDSVYPIFRDEMLNLLPKLKDTVSQHLASCNALTDLEVNTEKFRHQIMYLEEAKDDTLHPLYTLLIR